MEINLLIRETYRMTKHLTFYFNGYKTEDLIRRLMGGKLYYD